MPTATATFMPERHGGGSGVTTSPTASDRLLHREAAGAVARDAVVPVEPARDRVAAEVDDVAAEAIELGDHGVEHAVQVRRQLLGAALGPKLGGKHLRERREAGDVGEERRAAHAVGQLDTRRERPPAIA